MLASGAVSNHVQRHAAFEPYGPETAQNGTKNRPCRLRRGPFDGYAPKESLVASSTSLMQKCDSPTLVRYMITGKCRKRQEFTCFADVFSCCSAFNRMSSARTRLAAPWKACWGEGSVGYSRAQAHVHDQLYERVASQRSQRQAAALRPHVKAARTLRLP